MTQRTFEFPEETDTALERIAELTGRTGDNRIGLVIQDALRVYEWVLAEQAQGRRIVALDSSDIEALAEHPKLDGRRPALATLLAEPQIRRARDYFAAATA